MANMLEHEVEALSAKDVENVLVWLEDVMDWMKDYIHSIKRQSG